MRDRQKNLKQFGSGHDTANSRNCSLQLVNYPHFGFWQKPDCWVLIKVRWFSAGQCLCRCEGWAILQVFLMPHAAHKCCIIIKCASLLLVLLFSYATLLGHYFSYTFNSVFNELYLAQNLFLYYTLF